MNTDQTLLVAGPPRCGLSVTMQMLHAGGFPCQGEPPGFEPFPMGEVPWDKCHGTAVKVVDLHRQWPPDGDYLVIQLHRCLTQQAKSINKFTNVMTGLPPLPERSLASNLKRDVFQIRKWGKRQTALLSINFEDIISRHHEVIEKIAAFVDQKMDMAAMESVIVKRPTDCLPYMLEQELVAMAERSK